MKVKLIVSISAFVLTVFISFHSNVFLTSIKRGIFAFVIFYIFSSIIVKLLEREMILFNEQKNTNNPSNDLNNANDIAIETDDNKSYDLQDDFQPMKVEKLNNDEIDNMDPKMIASILRNLEDDNDKKQENA
jgi:hypothetical protein